MLRRALAGALIKLAHRVFPPTVTEVRGAAIVGPDGRGCATRTNWSGQVGELTGYEAAVRARQASRWN